MSKRGVSDLEKAYLNFYVGYYPGITAAKPLEIKDDRENNRVVVLESYSIASFWVWNEQKKRYEGQIEVPELMSYLRTPKEVVRQSPLGIFHPIEIDNTTVLNLPNDWNIIAKTSRVAHPAFEFIRDVRPTPRVVTINDTFQTYSDHVNAVDSATYAANLASARDATRYQLYTANPSSSVVAKNKSTELWKSLLPWVGVALFLLYLWKVYRNRRKTD